MFKRIHTYDLDGVLVDTAHRYRNLPDGSIDMPYWNKNHTEEKIAQDKILPLAKQFLADCLNPETYCILCTVRTMHILDIAFIVGRLGAPDNLLMVGEPRPPYSLDYILKRRALTRIFNLRQFSKLPKKLWEDNIRNIENLQNLFDRCYYVPSRITARN